MATATRAVRATRSHQATSTAASPAAAPVQVATSSATGLTNSTTSILKSNYVPLTPVSSLRAPRRVTLKSGYVRQLGLQPGEVDAVQQALAILGTTTQSEGTNDANFWSLLRQFEGTPLAAQLPARSAFTNVTTDGLITFGKALITIRQQAVQRLQQANSAASAAAALNRLNTAIVAATTLTANTSTSQIGMLNLERLEMTPAGIERGGLLATIPLAPKERTAVVQKEWSVTSQEFTSIVTDSLENYSETGVTENTQLAQSTTSQVSHSNQFNVTASASGSSGFVTASLSTQFGTQDQNSKSATDSRNNSVQTTRQASSRVKQSHKMTISTTTVTGSSESTTRMLENPSATDPIRIDYFSLMRKWYVALYRYGLRLTYDITVPEPGATMRETYMQLATLQDQVNGGFSFPLQYSAINATNYQALASQYGAQVSPPPDPTVIQVVGGPLSNLPGDGKHDWVMGQITLTVPNGYAVSNVTLEVMLSNTGDTRPFYVFGSGQKEDLSAGEINHTYNLTAFNNFMVGAQGSQSITYFVSNCGAGAAVFTITQIPTNDATAQWIAGVWSSLYNAAQQTYYTTQQALNAQISSIQNQIDSVDTLTLRREENDEIMKCVLRWLLGPNFEFMPENVVSLFSAAGGNLQYGVNFTGDDVGPPMLNWNLMYQNESTINFINEAIEWENVIFFLYSYFWDVPQSWEFIRQIRHPDSTRQAFLRAGAARVVLTVRQGWEIAWTWFVETGQTTLPSPLPPHPYLTIAQQIAAYDSTNYPGIPPANPDGGGPIDDDTPQVGTTCASNLAAGAVTIPVADATGFVVGATAIIDNWDAGIDPLTGAGPGGLGIGAQEFQTITAVTAAPPSITVQPLQYAHSVASGPFPVVQAGAKGVLIGEWFEYTPTSGTDIAVTSNLATIA